MFEVSVTVASSHSDEMVTRIFFVKRNIRNATACHY